LTEEEVNEMIRDRQRGMLVRECSEKYSISNDSVYRLIRNNTQSKNTI